MKNKNLYFRYFIFLCFVLNIVYAFKQNYGKVLDGDIIHVVLPVSNYNEVLKDPFGINVLLYKKQYAGTNRYFSHETMYIWFRPVQKIISSFFKDKVTAIYVVSALFNTLIYVFVVLMMAAYLARNFSFKSNQFLLAVLMVIPLIHQNGWNESIGIIDHSVSYTFFYGLPLCLLLLYMFPFYKHAVTGDQAHISFSKARHILWALLAVYISFSGALIQPLVLMICPIILIFLVVKKRSFKSIPLSIRIYFMWIIILCVYSFYIGRYNSENAAQVPGLHERYLLLMQGIPKFFSKTPAYIYILILFAVNIIILRKIKLQPDEKRILRAAPLVIIFCLIYIALLPLGGYRVYRPFIIRYDTFMPVTFIVLFYLAFTSLLVVSAKNKIYISFIVIIGLIFLVNDKPLFHANKCEKYYLRTLSHTKEDTLVFPKDCNIIEWHYSTTFSDSRSTSLMLTEWGITKKPVYFYQE
ncbi:MAG: hypothetical protein JWN78_3218 [Bacteroidota bacterium]|nr:hypothetical protein [Bacteroidota bacterium]